MTFSIPAEYIESYRLVDQENNKLLIQRVRSGKWILTQNISMGDGRFIQTTGEEVTKFKIDLHDEVSRNLLNEATSPIFFDSAEEAYLLLKNQKKILSIAARLAQLPFEEAFELAQQACQSRGEIENDIIWHFEDDSRLICYTNKKEIETL